MASLANSAEEVLRAVEESVRKDLSASLLASLENAAEKPHNPLPERAKVVISIQNKDELKQFRVYTVSSFWCFLEAE